MLVSPGSLAPLLSKAGEGTCRKAALVPCPSRFPAEGVHRPGQHPLTPGGQHFGVTGKLPFVPYRHFIFETSGSLPAQPRNVGLFSLQFTGSFPVSELFVP